MKEEIKFEKEIKIPEFVEKILKDKSFWEEYFERFPEEKKKHHVSKTEKEKKNSH